MQLKELHLDLLESHASLKRRHDSLSEEQVHHLPLLCHTVSLRAEHTRAWPHGSPCLRLSIALLQHPRCVLMM